MNMKKWLSGVMSSPEKKAMPILSFPCVSLIGCTVRELVTSSELQIKGMKTVADEIDTLASVSMMDLSVEAEAFGAQIRFDEDEVPSVIGSLVSTEEDADALSVPNVGTGRTGIYTEAIRAVCETVTDRPVFAGMIGPFSLAGRLVGVSEALVDCYDEPEMMKKVADKAAEFLISYAESYKKAGANGILMAEPLTGLLSPALAEEFSEPYVKRIIDAVQTDDFAILYHNCGNYAMQMIESILRTGAMGYHFGNAVNMRETLALIPENIPVFGNIDPSSQFQNGTPETMKAETMRLLRECSGHRNFIISSGCDIPPKAPWSNIHAFMDAVKEYCSDILRE